MNTLEKTIEQIMQNNKSAKQDIAILMKQLRAANEARLEHGEMLTDHHKHVERWLAKERGDVLDKRQKEREFVDEILRSTIYSEIGQEDLEGKRNATSMARSGGFDKHTFGNF